MTIAFIRFGLVDANKQLSEMFKTIKDECQEKGVGSPFVIFHYDTKVEEGQDVEACYQVTEPVETENVKSRTFQATEVLSYTHKGPRESALDNARKILVGLWERGVRSSLYRCEVYHFWDKDNPQSNELEIQIVPHNWIRLFADGLDRVNLGEKAKREILDGYEKITHFTSLEERVKWVRGALIKLKDISTEDQTREAISGCGQKFPDENIAILKAIYEEHGLEYLVNRMITDPLHMAAPVRDGNLLYFTKAPANKKGYDEAETWEEKRPQACWVALAKQAMLKGLELPPIFCYTSARWFKRLWENILDQPVLVEMARSALNGDRDCTFVVHLPQNKLTPG